MTEAGTSLRTCSLEQCTFQSLLPAGRNLKISQKRDCAGLHRPADFILICVIRAKTCASCYALAAAAAAMAALAHPSCLWLLGMVSGPAHGPRPDAEKPAASARPPILVAFSLLKEVPHAASQRRRNSAVVPSWDERKPSQDGGD